MMVATVTWPRFVLMLMMMLPMRMMLLRTLKLVVLLRMVVLLRWMAQMLKVPRTTFSRGLA